MDDPYPGYGQLARRRDHSLEMYTSQEQEFSSQLQAVRNEAISKIDGLIVEVEKGAAEYKNIQANRVRLVNHFNAYATHLQKGGNELLSVYRRANVESRPTPPPVHFGAEWTLSRPGELMDGFLVPDKSIDELLNDCSHAFGRAADAPTFFNVERLNYEWSLSLHCAQIAHVFFFSSVLLYCILMFWLLTEVGSKSE